MERVTKIIHETYVKELIRIKDQIFDDSSRKELMLAEQNTLQ